MEPPRQVPKLAPYLVVRDALGLRRFIQEGLGGVPGFEVADPSGALAHAEVRLADSVVMLAEAPPGHDLWPAMLHLYVADPDAAYRRALAAGGESVRPPTDQPNGDRRGGVKDRWGNQWWFSRGVPAR